MSETLINSNQLNVGDESAIDLLIERNTAKKDLAVNLSGKGITANASTETLNELVQKVANISSDSSKEYVESITTNITYGSAYKPNKWRLRIKDYIFFVKNGDPKLYYAKISDIEQGLASNNTSGSVSTLFTSVSAGNNFTNNNDLTTNSDYTKLYVVSTNANVAYFDIVWDGDTITSVTFNSTINFDSQGEWSISSNSDASKILYANAENKVKLYASGSATSLFTLSISGIFNSCFVRFVGDNQFVVGYVSSSILYVLLYSLEGTTATLVSTSQIACSNFMSTSFYRSVAIIEYATGKYKVIMGLRGILGAINTNKLAIYDTDTKTITMYNTNIATSGLYSNDTYSMNTSQPSYNNPTFIDVTYNSTLERYYIVYGSNFFIFDTSWNLKNSFAANMSGNSNAFTGWLWCANANTIVAINADLTAIKAPFWLNKKTVIQRTVSINDTTKDIFLTANGVTVADIEAGYYD